MANAKPKDKPAAPAAASPKPDEKPQADTPAPVAAAAQPTAAPAKPKPASGIEVTRDPDNPNTVILSRWPTEEVKKSSAFQQQLREAGRSAPTGRG